MISFITIDNQAPPPCQKDLANGETAIGGLTLRRTRAKYSLNWLRAWLKCKLVMIALVRTRSPLVEESAHSRSPFGKHLRIY